VEFEAEQVLRIRADFVHGRVLVANVELVFVRHGGRQFKVLCEFASMVVMAREGVVDGQGVASKFGAGRTNVQVRDQGDVTRGEAGRIQVENNYQSTDLRQASSRRSQ
jgi:hypothetical protein